MNGHHPLDFNREPRIRDDLTSKLLPRNEELPTEDVTPPAYVLPTLHHAKQLYPVKTTYYSPTLTVTDETKAAVAAAS